MQQINRKTESNKQEQNIAYYTASFTFFNEKISVPAHYNLLSLTTPLNTKQRLDQISIQSMPADRLTKAGHSSSAKHHSQVLVAFYELADFLIKLVLSLWVCYECQLQLT